jgi:hypothetical protein
MNFAKWLYQIRNLPAHWRAFWLGTTNGDGNVTFEGQLAAKVIRANGKSTDLGVVSRRVVTTAGVNYLRDDFANGAGGADISLFKFHDAGTGTTAEAIGDTDLVTPAGPTTRATGTQVNGVAKTYSSVATISYTTTLAITEHGLFTQAARAGGVLWDRSVFSAINVVNGDSIQFTYTLTIADGG